MQKKSAGACESHIHSEHRDHTPLPGKGSGDGSDTGALRAQKKTDVRISLFLCPEQDSNLHSLAATSP